MQKAIVYLRVSTEEQAEKGFSMMAQREECMKKACQLGCMEDEIFIFSDEGVSGAILERPQLVAALELLKKGGINYFIAMDTSRLSRNVSHQLMLVDEIKRRGAELVFIRNSYQDNPEGRFQITIMAAVDEYERARLKLRTEMGKRAKAKQHLLTHNPGIYGYDFDVKTDCLYINAEQASTIKMMYSWLIDEGMGPGEIAGRLNETGTPSPRMKLWNRVTVRRILSNESYTGTLYIRRYDTREYHLNKYKKAGEKVKVVEKPRNEWIPVQIPEIIHKEDWQQAQNMLQKSRRILANRSKKDGYLLSSILKCKACGCFLNGKHVKSGNKDYNYYICPNRNNRKADKNCNLSLIKSEELEIKIWELLQKHILDNTKAGIYLNEIAEKTLNAVQNRIGQLWSEVEKSKAESERLITLFQKGFISEEEMCSRLDKLKSRIKMLQDKLDHEDAAAIKACNEFDKIINSKNIYTNIEEILIKMDKEGRKHIIESLISEILVSEDCILVKGSF